MRLETIQKLNQLNADFYQKIAVDFNQTRQRPWDGWKQLLPTFKEQFKGQKSLKVLDLACGNGRFGAFLIQNLQEFNLEYWGVDSNEYLLEQAQDKLAPLTDNFTLSKVDIIESLIEKSPLLPESQTFDMVVAFGLIHHIPSTELRKAFIASSLSLSKPSGLVVIAAWQFDTLEKMMKRAVDSSTLGINPSELEPNDFILPWDRGSHAYRYSHLLKPDELPALLPIKVTPVTSFLADNSNYYTVLKIT